MRRDQRNILLLGLYIVVTATLALLFIGGALTLGVVE